MITSRTFIPLFTSLCFFAFAAGPVESAEVLKFSAILDMAKTAQINWREAELAHEKAQLNLLGSRSGFLPDLGIRSNYTYDYQGNTQTDTSNSSAALVSSWSLYDNGSSFRNYRIRRLELERAELQELAATNNVSYDIFDRYLRHFLSRRQREITVGKLGLLQAQYRLTERQYRQGLKTRRDYQRLESETERARLSLLRQEDAVQDTFNELKRYVGAGAEALTEISYPAASVSGFLAKFDTGEREWVDLKRDKIIAVQVAEIDKDVKRVQALEADTPLWPVLGVKSEVGYGSTQFLGQGQKWSDADGIFGLGMVTLNWNFWDWGQRRSVARSAQLDERLAHLRRSQSELDANMEFDKLRRDHLRLKKSLSVVRRVYEIEQSTFRDIEAEYRDGRASYLDMITSLDRRSQAELDVEQETINLLLNMSQILKMTGELYEACRRF